MATLTGNTIASTYTGLLSVSGAVGADTVEAVTDGAGTSTSLSLSQQRATITLGSEAADDFIVDGTTLVVEGDNNRVGIGTAAPANIVHVVSGGDGILVASAGAGLILDRYADATYASDIYSRKARGSKGSEEAIHDDDLCLKILGQGWDLDSGGAFVNCVSIEGYVDGAVGNDDMPGRLVFKTSPDGSATLAERMRIDSAGDVTFTGEIDCRTSLDVQESDGTDPVRIKNTGGDVSLQTHGTNTNWTWYRSANHGGEAVDNTMFSMSSNNNSVNVGSASCATDLTVAGDIVMADGKGIDFSANIYDSAGMTGELLDDYEEGTWDAMVTDGTNDMAMHGSADTGYYTKVGNLVTVTGHFITTSLGSASGAIRITGLPFTVANNNAAYSGGGAAEGGNFDLAAAGQSVSYYGVPNSTYIYLRVWNATTGVSYMQASEWTLNGKVTVGFSYRAA